MKYQIYLKLCRSTAVSLETTTDPNLFYVNIAANLEKSSYQQFVSSGCNKCFTAIENNIDSAAWPKKYEAGKLPGC